MPEFKYLNHRFPENPSERDLFLGYQPEWNARTTQLIGALGQLSRGRREALSLDGRDRADEATALRFFKQRDRMRSTDAIATQALQAWAPEFEVLSTFLARQPNEGETEAETERDAEGLQYTYALQGYHDDVRMRVLPGEIDFIAEPYLSFDMRRRFAEGSGDDEELHDELHDELLPVNARLHVYRLDNRGNNYVVQIGDELGMSQIVLPEKPFLRGQSLTSVDLGVLSDRNLRTFLAISHGWNNMLHLAAQELTEASESL